MVSTYVLATIHCFLHPSSPPSFPSSFPQCFPHPSSLPSSNGLHLYSSQRNLLLYSQELAQGVDIVVGVPGKLCGLLDSKSLDLSQIRFFVLDEADALAFGENYQMVSQLARYLVSVI